MTANNRVTVKKRRVGLPPAGWMAAAVGTVLLLVVPPAVSQTSPEVQAVRLLEDGRSYRVAGQHKQALDNFKTIVTGFPDTTAVDDALLEIGRYYVEVERDVAKARESFEKVAQGFPQSDGAPGAYYHLGLLTMGHADSQAELDDALAQFRRVQRLYPRSAWVPRALQAEGLALRKGGQLEAAVVAQRRVTLEHPNGDAAPAAQFQIGHLLALLGDPLQAMEEYQQVRNRFPGSEWAEPALDRITGLYRLYGTKQARFEFDPSYSTGSGELLKDVVALLMTPGGTLWVASNRVRSAVSFDVQGRLGPGLPGQELRTLTWTPGGEVLLTTRSGLRLGRDVRSFSLPATTKPEPEPLENLSAGAVLPDGSLLVVDEKKRRIYRYGADFAFQGVFGDDRERRIRRLVLDTEGRVLALDADKRTVEVFDGAGKVVNSLTLKGGGYELRKPTDLAVDSARNLYVSDRTGAVYVFSPEGRLMTSFGAAELKKAEALTLEPSGAVLVYDAKLRRILRYR